MTNTGEQSGTDDWIFVDGLAKTYWPAKSAPVQALESTSFRVQRGEFICVVGPSGCGRTTLLNVLAGLIPRSAGDVSLADRPVNGPRRDIGVVFQSPTLLPWRTILDNVMIPVQVQKLQRSIYLDRAKQLIEMVGLSGFEDSYPDELSGGMQQRAGICRALVHDPDVLLMDEPFGALDAMTREFMNMELLRIWQESGKTIVLITHGISEAVFLADRVFVMTARPGRLAEEITIDLPRPRSLDMLQTPEVGAFIKRIRQHFTAKDTG
ncbi:MAG: ABC transporter ATP-binding protein [Acidimicrobiales bacterium]